MFCGRHGPQRHLGVHTNQRTLLFARRTEHVSPPTPRIQAILPFSAPWTRTDLPNFASLRRSRWRRRSPNGSKPEWEARPASVGDGHDLRSTDTAIPSNQGRSVHDAGCGDEFVSRVATKVKTGGCACDGEVERPDVNADQSTFDVRVIQVDDDPSELREFPQHDGGHAPGVPGQDRSLSGPQVAAQRVDENVCVKIQYRRPRGLRWRGGLRGSRSCPATIR